MSPFLGSDPDALRDLARLYERGAATLEQAAGSELDRAPGVTWVGADADAFRIACHQARVRLAEVHDAIRAWADCFVAQAEQQDTASQGGAAGSGGGPGAQPTPPPGTHEVPVSVGDGRSWGLPDIFPDVSPHDWIPPVLKEGAEAIAERLEQGVPVAERVLKKGTPLIPDLYDAGRHYVNGETAEGNFAVLRAMVSGVPYVGTGVDMADIATSADPGGSLLDRAEQRYVEAMNDPNSAISQGEREGLRRADELGIENEYARNITKSIMGNGKAWEEHNTYRDENGKINPWIM
ncbi:hypothetical protein [Brachybacterium sp. UNK5269]|uniref:hypothetical protein n=1 Tax=Brachybacterium sp. UNK5269 TaxID=3408576 RepID=UPI003BB09FD2